MGVPRRLGSGVAWLQEVTPSSGPERRAVAPSSPAFVTASWGCQEELLHRFLKCFAVARTARCSASRASGKSRRHRAEPRQAERSLTVGAECGAQGGRLQFSGPQPSPPRSPSLGLLPPVRDTEPPRRPAQKEACWPSAARCWPPCWPRPRSRWSSGAAARWVRQPGSGRGGCDMGSFRGQRKPTRTRGARPGLAHLCGRGGGSRAPCCV